jgi:hypothetical protein
MSTNHERTAEQQEKDAKLRQLIVDRGRVWVKLDRLSRPHLIVNGVVACGRRPAVRKPFLAGVTTIEDEPRRINCCLSCLDIYESTAARPEGE